VLDRMVIWRTGYRFNNTGTAQGPWTVQGYRADGSVIGGPFTGETCVIQPGQPACRFGAEGAMAAGARVDRDLETSRIVYSVGCVDTAGCSDRERRGLPVRRAEHLRVGGHGPGPHPAARDRRGRAARAGLAHR
jgi:hypothetical protein